MSTSNPAFDEAEQEILSKLTPEGEEPGSEPEGQAPAEAPPAAPAAPEPTSPPAEAPAPTPAPGEPPAQPQGDVRGALRAARRSEKRALDEVERLRAENEALKSGTPPVNSELTDEEIAALEDDYPVIAKGLRSIRAVEAKVAQIAAPKASEEFIPMSYAPEVQEIIDSVPELLTWQHDPASQDKFAQAVEFDKALMADPAWKGRPATERFAESARLVTSSTSKAPAAPAAPRLDPAAVIAAAPLATPEGISDFRGGQPPNQSRPNYAALSDEAIISSLKPED